MWILEASYAVCFVIFMFALTNRIGKAFDDQNYALGISLLVITLLLFFGGFLFAKFLFGF